MAKIPTIKPRVPTLKPRMSAPKGEKARLRDRDETQSWRKWYYTAAWQKLRQEVWKRDKYTCSRSGVLCIGKYPAGNSPVANHITPHKGDPELFWDINNIETVAKSVHDSLIQSEERREGY